MKNITRFRKLIAMAMGFVIVAAVSVWGMLAIIVQPEAVTIVRFEPLDPQVIHQTVPFGTNLDDLNLPAYLDAVAMIQAAQGQQSMEITLPFGFSTFGIGGSVGTAQISLVFGMSDVNLDNSLDLINDSLDDAEPDADLPVDNNPQEPDETDDGEPDASYNDDPETAYPPYQPHPPDQPDDTDYENGADEYNEYNDEYNDEALNKNDENEYENEQDEDSEYEQENEYELPEYDEEYVEDEEDECDEEPQIPATMMLGLLYVPVESFYVQVPVSWHVSFAYTEEHGSTAELAFNGETVGQFVFTAVLASGYRLAAGVKMPTITVDVVFPFGAMAAVAPFALGNLVESGNIEGNLPWSFYSCGTLVLEAGVLPHGSNVWPRRNEIARIEFTGPVVAGENMRDLFHLMPNLIAIEELTYLDTSNVTNMDSMFWNARGLTSLDLSSFDTSSVTNMFQMFDNASSLISLDLTNFDTSNVTNMSGMFTGTSNLTSLNVSSFNTSNVTNMSRMFDNAGSLTSLDVSSFDTSRVTNMHSMFRFTRGLTSLDISNFDTSRVTNMHSMFFNASGLTSLDLSNFDTSNVWNMGTMFGGASGLTSLDLSSFDTGNVTNMTGMFNGANSLTSLDISSFDTSSVTEMIAMFNLTQNLTSLDLSNFDTGRVTNMERMFSNAWSLASLNLSNFDTSNVTNMSNMFASTHELISLDLSSFDTSRVTTMNQMFAHTRSLTSLDLSSFDTRNTTNMNSMFNASNNLNRLILGDNIRFIGTPLLRQGNWTNEQTGITLTTQELITTAAPHLIGTWVNDAPPIPPPNNPPNGGSGSPNPGSGGPYHLDYTRDTSSSNQNNRYTTLDLRDTDLTRADIPRNDFNNLYNTRSGLIIHFPDGSVTLNANLVRHIARRNPRSIEIVLHNYREYDVANEVLSLLCFGDTVHNVRILLDGRPLTNIPGRLSVTVPYDRSLSPGVWRIGEHGELFPQEFVFNASEELVTFFPDRLSNFIVGYSAEARTIAIFRADGNNTTLRSRGRETTNLRDGQRLSSGDSLVAGSRSEIFITMDNSSIVKLGENSAAEINESGRSIELRVTSGNALVRVDNQQPHHETTVRAQNVTAGVRGTMFTVSIDDWGNETVVMLSGRAEVNGAPLMAGYMYVMPVGEGHVGHDIRPITVDAINDFTLAAIVGNYNYLARHLNIDLTGVNIAARPLPTLREIRNLLLEDFEIGEDPYCEDDCLPQNILDLPHFGRRC